MTLIHGFNLISEETVDEINSVTRLYRHEKSGAELLSVINNDENKVFSVTFKTPPKTSNGIAHIMEHCVLCGSRKYPVKEPFIEMVKGSLNTYLNAFTASDRTSYPVASTNEKDFYNLIDVYVDAVFFPLLSKHNLEQEGWHYELESLEDPLVYRGVVFNEMKGAYSSPEGNLGRRQQETLFDPSHPYGVDSGGDPVVIPELSYDEFLAFHQKYYHPSNARIYFYGDDDPEKRLAYLNEVLSEFDAIEIEAPVDFYPLRDETKRFEFPYAVDPGEDDAEKNFVTINWLLPAVEDKTTEIGYSILSRVLSGTPGAPLRRALMDSGLGEDVIGGGVYSYLRQPVFEIGMKGVLEENISQVEELIIKALVELVETGIDMEDVTAAVNTLEFRLREANTGGFPRGLAYMMSAMRDWVHGGDPIEALRYEGALSDVKEKIAAGGYFEHLIANAILENQHRSTVIMKPDAELTNRLEKEEEARLAEAKADMTETELEAIIENTKVLKAKQVEPNAPEDLAKLPTLLISDLDREIKSLPIEVDTYGPNEVISHDLFTNGIVYFRLGMNMRVIPQDLLPYLPLFSASLTEIGTKNRDYIKLSQWIGKVTGGIGASEMVVNQRDNKEAMAWFWLRGKSTTHHTADMLEIMREVLFETEFDNQARFRQMVSEEKAREESRLIPAGHRVVLTRLQAAFAEANAVGETMGGLSYLEFLRDLVTQVDENWPSVLEKLEQIRSLLLNRNIMLVDTTLDAENYANFRPQINAFLDNIPTAEPEFQTWTIPTFPAHEGLTIPAQVNYVGKGANIFELGFEDHGSIRVALNLIRTGHLWDKVRMQGGAYGAFIPYNSRSGVLSYGSYRDPNLLNTLDAYDETPDVVRSLDLPQQEIDRAIIGVIGDFDTYQLPDAKGNTALMRYLHKTTDEYRQQLRNEVLNTTLADIKRFAEVLDAVRDNGRVVVLGSADAIDSANSEEWMTITKAL